MINISFMFFLFLVNVFFYHESNASWQEEERYSSSNRIVQKFVIKPTPMHEDVTPELEARIKAWKENPVDQEEKERVHTSPWWQKFADWLRE